MTTDRPQRRRLVAMMFTDMVGYSALASRDEALAFELLKEHRALLRRIFPVYGGRENKTVGDAFFIEFGSAVEAVQCAIEIQTSLYERNIQAPDQLKLQLRIGLHLGDVIDFEGDAYGEGVNIASRVESKARPGGVFLTRQIFDQAAQSIGFPIEKVGKFTLKNISTPSDIYRVKFPWDVEKERSWFRSQALSFKAAVARWRLQVSRENPVELWKARVATGLFAGVMLALVGAFFVAPQVTDRVPASITLPDQRLDLSYGWKFSPDGTQWQDFDPLVPWNYAARIGGSYWLRNDFRVPSELQYPAIVLGVVSGAHRVFLNGQFIGGANYSGSLEYYSFDRSLLKTGHATNRLLISADGAKTANPGITSLASVGTFLGEFDQVHKAVFTNRVVYDVLRSVYLALAFVISFACLTYYLMNRSKIEYLYFALYLLLGAIALAYYNTIVASVLDYRYRRFLKVFTMALSSCILFSAYLNLQKQRKLELINNLAGFVLGGGIAMVLLRETQPEGFLQKYDAILWAILAYTAAWVGVAWTSFLWGGWRDFSLGATSVQGRLQQLTAIFFGMVSLVLNYVSLKSGNDAVAREWRSMLGNLAISYPFLFALMVLIAGIRDYFRKSLAVSLAESRNSLILNLVRVVTGSSDLEEAINQMQKQVNDFVGAERSTIYLLENEGSERWLKAKYVFGKVTAHHIKKVQAPREGIIGYVCTSRSPLLIRDLASDLRFSDYFKQRPERRSYKTGSCMVLPLISGGELIGILTVADKRDGGVFCSHDFALMHVVAKDLSLLIQNERLRALVKQYLAA